MGLLQRADAEHENGADAANAPPSPPPLPPPRKQRPRPQGRAVVLPEAGAEVEEDDAAVAAEIARLHAENARLQGLPRVLTLRDVEGGARWPEALSPGTEGEGEEDDEDEDEEQQEEERGGREQEPEAARAAATVAQSPPPRPPPQQGPPAASPPSRQDPRLLARIAIVSLAGNVRDTSMTRPRHVHRRASSSSPSPAAASERSTGSSTWRAS